MFIVYTKLQGKFLECANILCNKPDFYTLYNYYGSFGYTQLRGNIFY